MTDTIRFTIKPCSLGSILVARSEKGVCAVTLGDDANTLVRDLHRRFPDAELTESTENASDVVDYVDRPTAWKKPLDVRGTPFQKSVWQALREIPCGTTASYAEIAKKIGKPAAVRAVAQACGANHISVLIPCHRVVRSNGALSGYHWGIERKKALLEREKTR